MNQPTTQNWAAPIRAKYNGEIRYFDTVEDADKWLEEMEAKDLATTEPPPQTEPRSYWLIVAKDGTAIASFDDPKEAQRTLDHWQETTYRIIEVQEIQPKEPQCQKN